MIGRIARMKPMKQHVLFLALILIASAAAPTAEARQSPAPVFMQQVTINEGKVLLNGRPIATAELPQGLRDLDSSVNLSFWTTDEAIVQINDASYTFRDGKFFIADEDAIATDNRVMFFSDREGEATIRLYQPAEVVTGYAVTTPRANANAMQSYLAALREQAIEFENLTVELKQMVPESNALAAQLVVEAENTARLAQNLPRAEYESYLGNIQGANQFLYRELVREREMEARTHALARRIRMAESNQEREKLTEELRTVLTEIFELKQANRQQEIEQLTLQLRELESRLQERSDLQDDIIDSRLKDLLELHRW